MARAGPLRSDDKERNLMLRWFDANVALGRPLQRPPVFFETAADLVAVLRRYGIERALVYDILSRELHPADGNARLRDTISRHEELMPAFSFVPGCACDFPEPEDFLTELHQHGGKAVWFFPHQQWLGPQEYLIGPYLAALEAHRVPLFYQSDITMGDPRHAEKLGAVHDLCQRHPQLPVVFTAPRVRYNRALYLAMQACPNLYCDTVPFWNFNNVEHFARNLGPERVLFGSGLPHRDPGGILAMVALARLDDDSKQKIAGGNLERLLQEVKWS